MVTCDPVKTRSTLIAFDNLPEEHVIVTLPMVVSHYSVLSTAASLVCSYTVNRVPD